ncbi:hypothetical protein AB0P40_33040 [Streptomyces sp. NPDC079189]|uniref:hypothetical protein n=1 Tax=unclassified Streptomyces TaxID=2593676 RepID=UPI0033B39B20
MKQALIAAQQQGLQRDLRVLAGRIRAAAAARPGRSSEFDAGVDWAVLWIENTADSLTQSRS